jgi:hypothetical protein
MDHDPEECALLVEPKPPRDTVEELGLEVVDERETLLLEEDGLLKLVLRLTLLRLVVLRVGRTVSATEEVDERPTVLPVPVE